MPPYSLGFIMKSLRISCQLFLYHTKDYSLSSMNYQLKLPFELEVLIPDDDPVRLLSAFVEELELTDLYRSYGKIKKDQVTPTVI